MRPDMAGWLAGLASEPCDTTTTSTTLHHTTTTIELRHTTTVICTVQCCALFW